MPSDGQMSKMISKMIFMGKRWNVSEHFLDWKPKMNWSREFNLSWKKNVFLFDVPMEIDRTNISNIHSHRCVFVSRWIGDRCLLAFLYESVTNTINYTYLGSYILKLNRTFICLPSFHSHSLSLSLSLTLH